MAHKKRTRKEIMISLLLVFLAASISVLFFCFLAVQNTISANEIKTVSGTVQIVEDSFKPKGIYIEVKDNDEEFLIPKGFSNCSKLTGYDSETLEEILLEQTVEIQYFAHSDTNHIISITVDEKKFDFLACVRDYNNSVHLGVLVFIIMSFVIIGAVWYYTFWNPKKNKRFPEFKKSIYFNNF